MSADEGWAAGTGETLLHTVDGGATWTRQRLPARLWADGLEFVDEHHGWLSSLEGVYGTTDGGATWSRLLAAGNWFPAAVSFASPDAGWVVGTGGLIRRTTDGGQTWTTLNGEPAHVRPLADVAFADAQTGCAVGVRGTVVQTADGGSTWTVRRSGTTHDLVDVAFDAGSQTAYAVGTGIVLRSSDGGVTWSHCAVTSPGSAVSWTAVSAPDASHVTVAGARGAWPGKAVVARSADGGAHWKQTVVGDGLEPESLSFPDSAHGWLTTDDHERIRARALWRTTDGGATWRLQGRIWDGRYREVQFIDALNGWMTAESDAEVLLHTADGGDTWSEVDAGYEVETGGRFGGFFFADVDNGWAIAYYDLDATPSSACLFHTTDGGAHWSVQGIGSAGAPTGLAAAGASDVWIVGLGRTSYGGADGSGQILHAADGGGTAPQTGSTLKNRWRPLFVNEPATTTLSVRDAGSGVAGTWYRIDRFTNVWDWGAQLGTWLPATDGQQIDFLAPADHSADGYYRLQYYSEDLQGTRESPHVREVTVDTLGPDCVALRPAPVRRGHLAVLRYRIHDATSPYVRIGLKVRTAGGRVMRDWSFERDLIPNRKDAGSRRFVCDLPAGRYRFEVTGIDEAGNTQARMGRATLVVRAAR